jgi:MFS family permease
MNQSIDSTPQNKAQISKLYGITLNGLIGQNLISIYVPYFAIALGASYSQQGLVTSLRTLGNTLTQSFWGNQSDKYGRRPIQIFGYVILAGTALLFTRSMNINLFLLLLALQGFCGFAVLPVVTNAMLGDVALERERGAFIGNVSSFGTFGLSYSVISWIGRASQALINTTLSFYRELGSLRSLSPYSSA